MTSSSGGLRQRHLLCKGATTCFRGAAMMCSRRRRERPFRRDRHDRLTGTAVDEPTSLGAEATTPPKFNVVTRPRSSPSRPTRRVRFDRFSPRAVSPRHRQPPRPSSPANGATSLSRRTTASPPHQSPLDGGAGRLHDHRFDGNDIDLLATAMTITGGRASTGPAYAGMTRFIWKSRRRLRTAVDGQIGPRYARVSNVANFTRISINPNPGGVKLPATRQRHHGPVHTSERLSSASRADADTSWSGSTGPGVTQSPSSQPHALERAW